MEVQPVAVKRKLDVTDMLVMKKRKVDNFEYFETSVDESHVTFSEQVDELYTRDSSKGRLVFG